MKRPRAHVSLKVKLASALVTLWRVRLLMEGRIEEERQVFEHSKGMTADQIMSLFHFDHFPVRHADAGPDEPWNLCPQLIHPHRTKTTKVDRPALAKQDRIGKQWREFNRAMAAGRKPPPRTSKWPKRKLIGRN